MAGTVYREIFNLLGRDYIVPLPTAVEMDASLPARDNTLRHFGGSIYAASADTPAINRLTVTVAKSLLNEDPERYSSGSEAGDEVGEGLGDRDRQPADRRQHHPAGFSPLVTGTWT